MSCPPDKRKIVYRGYKINGKFIRVGKSTKCISVRIPDMVYDIVKGVDGNSFSDKLIRLILEYKAFTDSPE